jgi:type IV pilus assembly protein PilV
MSSSLTTTPPTHGTRMNTILRSSTRGTHVRRLQRISLHRGFVMVEALLAGLIFAFGVLGVVGLQANMTQSQLASKSRADAVNLAQELVGVMWSDFGQVSQYDSTLCAGNVRCNAWQQKVAQDLPGATVNVSVATLLTGGGNVTIRLSWPTKAGQQSYVLQSSVIPQGEDVVPPSPPPVI